MQYIVSTLLPYLNKDVANKVKCVDDTLLYDHGFEAVFNHTWDYLKLCCDKGIVFNKNKFQFCEDSVEIATLKVKSAGILPSDRILTTIQDFPTAKTLTNARSWFGLVNQVAWAYAISPVMQPFRDLVKNHSQFYWDTNLDKIFQNSRSILINQVTKGIQTFDVNKPTCVQTDWSKRGLGYLLLQKYCQCPMDRARTCCQNGWRLVFAGSRFTHGAEANYSLTEGENLAVAWSLNHARMFVQGCETLIIATDHKPLLGIFNNRELSSISNTRISKLQEKTLAYNFKLQNNPGKWNQGANGFSRYSAHLEKQDEQLILHFYSEQKQVNTTDYSKKWECNFQVNEITCIDALNQNNNTNHNQGVVILDKLKLARKNDILYEKAHNICKIRVSGIKDEDRTKFKTILGSSK